MIGGVTSPNLSRLTGAPYLLGEGSASARVLSHVILEFPALKKQTTRNAMRDKQTILSPCIELTN